MNEEAIDIMYKMAIDEGYRKSKVEFLKLMSEDLDALSTMYENAKKEGYTKTLEEFSVLLGNKTLPEKKNPDLSVTDSPSEDGSSVSPATTEKGVKGLKEIAGMDDDGGSFDMQEQFTIEDVKDKPSFDYEQSLAAPMDATARGQQSLPELPKDAMTGEFLDDNQLKEIQERRAEEDEAAQALYEQKQKEERELENLQIKNAHNALLYDNIEFQEDIITVDDKLVNQKRDDVINYLTQKFSKYGFIFGPGGWGQKVSVMTADGLNEIVVEVDTSDPESSKKLKEFIVDYSTSPEARDIQVDDFVSNAMRAQQTRQIGRQNMDGTVSTHLMTYAEEDGRFVAFPMLFPTDPDFHSAWADRWTEFDKDNWEDALDFAKMRDEAYYFDTEEEAANFAAGNWKTVDSPELFAQSFYNKEGLDYFVEQEMWQDYQDLRDDLYTLSELADMDRDDRNNYVQLMMTDEEQERFKDYLYRDEKGILRADEDIVEQIEELEDQKEILQKIVFDNKREDMRDDLDLALQRNFEKKAQDAANLNLVALDFKDQMNVVSLKNFGVPIDDLSTVIPKNEEQAKLLQELISQADLANYTSQFAAHKYELSKLWFDRKNDENIMYEYLEGWAAFKQSLVNAWHTGKAGNILIQTELGMKDASDKEVQIALAEHMAKIDPRQSKFLYRYNRAKSGEAKKYVVGTSGMRIDLMLGNGIALAAESFTKMLPYGMWIVPSTTALGAGIGAGSALVAGQMGPQMGTAEEVITVPAGAMTGGYRGFKTGMALSGFVLEYTNSIFEAMREEGYDLTNPEDVAKAFNDKEVFNRGREIGTKRGIPIAIVDYISMGLAGRVFKVGKTAGVGKLILAQTAERIVFDPAMEGLGEYAAQISAGQEISGKEIFLESWGGLGNNTSGMAVNMFMDNVAKSNTELANNLLDYNFMANERNSDSGISRWSTNMNNLGKISDEQNQQIQQNVGYRRTAKDLLGKNANRKNIARVMELLGAKADLSRTSNLKQINSKTISDIDAEISEITTTGNLVEDAINLEAVRDVKALGAKQSKYSIDGKTMSKKKFLRRLNKLTAVQIDELDINVTNDNEVLTLVNNKKKDAIQESKTESVDVEKQTTDGATVGTRDTQQETTPESETVEVEEQATDVEVETPSIPNPLKATRRDKIKYANNELTDQRLDGLLAEVATKNMNNKKLTPFQQQLFKDNETRVAEIESDMQGAIDLEQSLKEGTESKVDFKTEGRIDDNVEFVQFKSQKKPTAPKMKRAPVEGGMENSFINLLNVLSSNKGRSGGGMMFTRGVFRNDPSFELDANLVTRIKNGEVEVNYAVLDGSKLNRDQRLLYQIPSNKARVFLHAEGQLLGRLEMMSGRQGEQMGKNNGTVTISEIHPALQGIGLGQQLYESSNDYVQETYNQPLKSDKNFTSERAERTWSAFEEKGKASRRKPTMQKSPSMQALRNKERQVMGETQFSFKDEKMLVDALNQAFATYGALTPSEISRVISGLVTEGDPVNNNTQMLAFMNKAFPSVNISSTQEAFNNVISRDDVRQYTRDGQVYYGVTVDGDIWINPEVHNNQSELFNTSIHEFGHVWTNYLQTTEKGQQIYRKGAELVQQTALYKRQLKKFNGDATKAVNETMAIMIANKGENIADASLLSKFTNWLQGMWTYIKTQFKMSKDLTTTEIENMTLDKFLGTALADIFSGKEIKLTDKQLIQLKNPEVMFSSTDSIIDIVNKGRQQGISDASIKSVLQSRGFKAKDINEAMKIKVDENVTLPTEFTNIEGGAIEGFRLFNTIKNKLNKFAYTTPEGKRSARRVRTYADVRAEAQRLLKESSVYQKQLPDVQRNMQIALDNSLSIRTNPTIQKEISAIRNILKTKKLAVKEIKALQNQLRGLIRRTLPKSDTYTQTQINSLLKRITDLTPENYVAKTEEVMKIIDKQKSKIRENTIKKIEKLVKEKAKVNITRGGRRVTKGLDARGQEFFRAVKNVLKVALIKDTNERITKIEKLKNDISPETILSELGITETELITKALNTPSDLTKNEQAMLDKIKAFDTVGDIMSATMEEVDAKLKILEEARAESIGRLQLKRIERAAKAEKLSQEATKQIEETYPELFTTDEKGKLRPKNPNELVQSDNEIRAMFKKGQLLKGVKAYFKKLKLGNAIGLRAFFKDKLAHLQTLTGLLDRGLEGKNFFTNNVWRPLRRMNRAQILGVERVNKKLDELANSIPGITKGYKQIRKKLYIGIKELNIKGKVQRFSGDQLLRIYALSKNETQRQKLEKQGFTQEKINEIKKMLGPQAIEFADKTVDFLSNEYFPGINEVYKESNDVSLEYVENYFPTRTITRTETSQALIEGGNFGSIFTDETHSALKQRTDVSGDVLVTDGFTDTLANHIDNMEHYKAYALGVKDLTAIINTPAVKVLLEESGLNTALKRAINFAINPQSMNRIKPGVVEKIMTKFTSYALAFRLMQIPKQASSFINAFEDYKFVRSRTAKEKQSGKTKLADVLLTPVELIAFMADMGYVMLTLPKQIRKAYNISPVFRDRIEKGLEGDLYGLVSGNPTVKDVRRREDALGEFLRVFRAAMGSPTVLGDIMGIMGYMANYNANIRSGMSHEQAVEAFEDYELTQQTRGRTEKIPLQMNNDMISRFFTMFGSTLFLQMNKVYMSATNMYRAGKKGQVDADAIRGFVLNLGMANVMFTLMANIFKLSMGDDDDREEVLKQMKRALLGMNLLSQVPLIGSSLEEAILKLSGENPRIQEGVNPFTRITREMLKSFTDENLSMSQKATKIAESLLELGVGFQFDPFISPVKSLIEEGKMTEETFYDVIGVSPSYRPNSSKKGSKSKNKKKSRPSRRGGTVEPLK